MPIGRPLSLTPNTTNRDLSVTATAGQTVFTVTGGYRINQIDVFRNGVKLTNISDFTAVNGSTVVLADAATLNDEISFEILDSFNVVSAIVSAASTQTVFGNLNVAGELYSDSLTIKSLTVPNNTTFSGVSTFTGNANFSGVTTFTGNANFSNVSIAGTLSYDDVVNIDSIGIITARKGIQITNDGGIVVTGVTTTDNIVQVKSFDGTPGRVDLYCEASNAHYARIQAPPHSDFAGNITLTLPSTSGTLLSSSAATVSSDLSIADKIVHTGDTNTAIRFPAADTITAETAGTERLRITSSGQTKVTGADDQDNFIVDAAQTQFVIHQDTTDGEVSLRAQDGSGNNFTKFMTFFTENGSGPEERLRITSAGQLNLAGNMQFTGANPELEFNNGGPRFRVPAANTLAIHNGGTLGSTNFEVIRIKSDGKVGIGSTIPNETLTVQGTSGLTGTIKVGEIGINVNNLRDSQTTIDRVPKIQVTGGNGVAASFGLVAYNSNEPGFYSPQLWLAKSNGSVGSNTLVTNNTDLGAINFAGNDGSKFINAASIRAEVDGTPGSDDMPGRLLFYTTNDGGSTPNEAMRIQANRYIFFGGYTDNFPGSGNTNTGMQIERANDGITLFVSRNTNTPVYFNRNNNGDIISCRRGGNDVGAVRVDASNTFFDQSSDYRLKENIVNLTSAISRVKQLEPKRFNYIRTPEVTIDGFLAHEVDTVVPYAVYGEYNGVDGDGNPLYQKLDTGKLIPLLTAALKESISEIEALEERVAELEQGGGDEMSQRMDVLEGKIAMLGL